MQQNMYIMVDIGIFDNVKIMRLVRKYGSDGIFGLFYLWFYTARYRPDGVLTGMDCEDIATAAKVKDDGQDFCQVLLDVGLIRLNDDGVYEIHDWQVHNHWFTMAKERSEKARKRAEARWSREKKSDKGNGEQAPAKSKDDHQKTVDMDKLASILEQLQKKVENLEEENKKIKEENQKLNAQALLQHCTSIDKSMLSDANRIERNRKEEKIKDKHGASQDAQEGVVGMELPVELQETCPNLKKTLSPEQKAWAGEYIHAVARLFPEKCPSMPVPAKITKDSDIYKQIAQRIRDAEDRRRLSWWREYFKRCEQSDVLAGKKLEWRASLGWLTKPKNMQKVLNGDYDNHTPAANPRASPDKGRIPVSKEFGRSDLGGIGRMMAEQKGGQ